MRARNNTLPLVLQGFAARDPEGAARLVNLLAAGAQFMSMRFDHTLKAQRDLLGCRTPEEMLGVQTDYIQTAAMHYLMATEGVIEMMGAQATAAKRAYDDVPL